MTDHLAALGWRGLSDSTGLQIEGIGTSAHYIGRAWSPDGVYESIPASAGMYVLLSIEGGGTVVYEGAELDVYRDHLIFLDSTADIEVHLARPTARYLWKLRPTVLNSRLVRERVGEPLAVDADTWKIAAALTNSALEAPAHVTDSHYLGQASESLLAAVFASVARPTRVAASTRPDHVYGEAMRVIAQDHHDPDLTPARVAAAVLVSDRTLRRAFAAMGSTPRAEIERRRTQELRSLIEHLGASVAFSVLCEMAGFSSARQGRAALRRAPGWTGPDHHDE